ncbi:MAG: tRNA lysidine(34) synthetase TilS [Tagaea sp.]|nr:tRNA lysidine(34) synthetase TilS [Tagaea sp.]
MPGLSPAAFARALDRLGPFEPHPDIAVAWSGGGDSTALLLLARDWARACGGTVRALHVDHGLRANSAGEAASLAALARDLGIDFAALRWDGPKPATGILEAARAARYALLERACAGRGILHLLVAHTAEDQAETVALRAERRSGPTGLAGMSAIVERAQSRVLRPLLGCAHADLLDTCRAAGVPWLEDPSNANPATARGRLRAAPPAALDPRAGDLRRAREADLAARLARAVAVAPEGFARLAVAELGTGDLAIEALTRLARTIGGGVYGARRARAEGALDRLREGRTATLGRCRFIPGPAGFVVAREAAHLEADTPLAPGFETIWDGRFAVLAAPAAAHLRVGALGETGWAELPRALRDTARSRIPLAARAVLPALRDLEGLYAVPYLLYGRDPGALDTLARLDIRFRPRHPLASARFV